MLRNKLFTLSMLCASFCYAQDTTSTDTSLWDTGGNLNINISNVGLSNWNGGGQSSLSIGGILTLHANREYLKSHWDNRVEMAYGMIKRGDDAASFRKTDDNLICVSKYGKSLNKRWLITAIIDFRTQFDKGFNYETDDVTGQEVEIFISDFLAPGYLLSSIGLSYKRKKVLSITYSPFTSKFTFVLDETLYSIGAFGVDPGHKIRTEPGSSLTTTLQKEVMENVVLSSNLNLFSNYKNPENIDINWETQLAFKVNKYISSNLSTQLIYDDDIDITRDDETVGPATQFKHVINLGISFIF